MGEWCALLVVIEGLMGSRGSSLGGRGGGGEGEGGWGGRKVSSFSVHPRG